MSTKGSYFSCRYIMSLLCFLTVGPRSDKLSYRVVSPIFTTKCEGFPPTSQKGVRNVTPGMCTYLLFSSDIQGRMSCKTRCRKNWCFTSFPKSRRDKKSWLNLMCNPLLIVRGIKDNVKDKAGDNLL